MKFPKDRMKVVSSYEGKTSSEGYLILEISAIDLEGVSKIYIDLADIAAARERGEKEADALQKAKEMLGF